MSEPELSVACYSGHDYAGEPRSVTWRGRRHTVDCVIASWRTPAGPAFRVLTESGMVFDLSYREEEDRWEAGSDLDSDDPGAGYQSASQPGLWATSGASGSITGLARTAPSINTQRGDSKEDA